MMPTYYWQNPGFIDTYLVGGRLISSSNAQFELRISDRVKEFELHHLMMICTLMIKVITTQLQSRYVSYC
jgi:hypothetical protein